MAQVAVRRALELSEGDEVVCSAGDASYDVRVMSRQVALEHARALVRQHARREGSAVDRLMVERRRDAGRKAGNLGRRRRRVPSPPPER